MTSGTKVLATNAQADVLKPSMITNPLLAAAPKITPTIQANSKPPTEDKIPMASSFGISLYFSSTS